MIISNLVLKKYYSQSISPQTEASFKAIVIGTTVWIKAILSL